MKITFHIAFACMLLTSWRVYAGDATGVDPLHQVTQVAKDIALLSQCGIRGDIKLYRQAISEHNRIFLGGNYTSNFDEKLDGQLKEQDTKSSSNCYENVFRIGQQYQQYQIESATRSKNGKYLHSRLSLPKKNSEKTFLALMVSLESNYSYYVRVCLSTKEERIKYSKTFKMELQEYLAKYWPYQLGDEVKASSMGIPMYGALIFESNEFEKPQKCDPLRFYSMGMISQTVHVLSAVKDDKAGVWLHKKLLDMEP
jgi:hypothetical protein